MSKRDDFWLDDPEWEMLRRKAANKPVPKELKKQAQQSGRPKIELPRQEPLTQASKEVTEKEVVLNLKLKVPKVKLPDARKAGSRVKQTYQSLGKRNKLLLHTGVVMVVAVLAIGAFRSLGGDEGKTAGVSDDPSVVAQEEAKAEFNPLVPLENLKDTSGEQAKPEFRFDKEKKVLAFLTEYNGANLTISQQQVPEDFKADPAKLMSVADSINANTPLETQKGTAYIATEEKSKYQTVVFATDEVLVFVRSNKTLDEESWKFYINQLNPAK